MQVSEMPVCSFDKAVRWVREPGSGGSEKRRSSGTESMNTQIPAE